MVTAKAIIDVYTTLSYDAMAVGPYDLAGGTDLLTRTFLAGTPWISANLFAPSGKPLFSPWVVKNIRDTRVGIIGLTGQVTQTTTYFTRNWQEALPLYINELTAACDFIILLSTLEKAENEAIADRFPQIQLIIAADPKAGNVAPLARHNSLVTQTHTRGKYLGILDIIWPNSTIWQTTMADAPSFIPELEKVYQQQLQTTDTSEKTHTTTVDRLHHKIDIVKKLQSDPENVQLGSFSFRFRSLAEHITKNPVVEQRLAALKKEIAAANRKAREATSPEVQSNPAGGRLSSEGEFTGSLQCGACHKEQYGKWQKSTHARALATLVREQQQYNVHCLSCHVTWDMGGIAGDELGTNLLSLPEARTNVGCESCHGAGRMHVDAKGEYIAFTTITKATCIKCHTPEMDPEFDFQTRLDRLGCSQQ
jgi:hypothetical protein